MFTKVINWTPPPACRGTDTPQATSDVGTRALGEATAHKNTMLLGREGNLIGLFSPQNPSCECSQCIQENIYKGLEEEVSEFCLSHGFPCRDRVHLRQRLLDEEKKNSKPLTNRKFRSRHASRQLLVVGACLSGDR